MNVGDIRFEKHSVDGFLLGNITEKECVVVYIHPKWRFYTVEFTTELGWKYRESYFFADKRPDGPPLPEHIRRQREFPAEMRDRTAYHKMQIFSKLPPVRK